MDGMFRSTSAVAAKPLNFAVHATGFHHIGTVNLGYALFFTTMPYIGSEDKRSALLHNDDL